MDEAIAVAIPIAFATLVTSHVALVGGLAARPPRWRALAALVVAPLAPWWGARAGMRGRAVAWGVAAAAYVALRVVARV